MDQNLCRSIWSGNHRESIIVKWTLHVGFDLILPIVARSVILSASESIERKPQIGGSNTLPLVPCVVCRVVKAETGLHSLFHLPAQLRNAGFHVTIEKDREKLQLLDFPDHKLRRAATGLSPVPALRPGPVRTGG